MAKSAVQFFKEIFVLRLETFLMPVQLENQQQILPFQERNIDILKSKHFWYSWLYYL